MAYALPKDFLVEGVIHGELISDIRHEYIGGEVYAMVGASDRHRIDRSQLGNRPAPPGARHPMPVIHDRYEGPPGTGGANQLLLPRSATELRPRRPRHLLPQPSLPYRGSPFSGHRAYRPAGKLYAYTTIPSLQEYLLLSQDQTKAEIYRRNLGWQTRIITKGVVPIQCLGYEIALTTVLRGCGIAEREQ
ncbi:MAG: hypothetical protein U5J62_04770 [Desulfurivibrio sp.]|nr:hypothetical protein [Desulfurivibrio sp.]